MSGSTTGSAPDVVARLKAVLPLRWFPDTTPLLDGLLTGLASAWSIIYAMLGYVRLQTRIATVTDSFVDLAASDYCGPRLQRRAGETDAVFRQRLLNEVLRERATRGAMISLLTDLTGRVPSVIEPAAGGATGGYGIACGYGTAGSFGSISMPFQCLVTAFRPLPAGTVWTGGTGPGAPVAETIEGVVTDGEIYAAIAGVAPIATIAWTAISN